MPLTDQDVEVLDQALPQPFGALLKAHHATPASAAKEAAPMLIPSEARKVLERHVDRLWARTKELSARREELTEALAAVDEDLEVVSKARAEIVGLLHRASGAPAALLNNPEEDEQPC